jgi:hypothetical protein
MSQSALSIRLTLVNAGCLGDKFYMPPCSTRCRLRLFPAVLEQQQVLLQARLLHMLLPLQQAVWTPPPAAESAETSDAAAAAGDTTKTTHQHQNSKDQGLDLI